MDEPTLEKVARLARIRLEPDERAEQLSGLTRILDHFASIARIPLPSDLIERRSGCELRIDEAKESTARPTILGNAPNPVSHEDGTCFSVPRVIE